MSLGSARARIRADAQKKGRMRAAQLSWGHWRGQCRQCRFDSLDRCARTLFFVLDNQVYVADLPGFVRVPRSHSLHCVWCPYPRKLQAPLQIVATIPNLRPAGPYCSHCTVALPPRVLRSSIRVHQTILVRQATSGRYSTILVAWSNAWNKVKGFDYAIVPCAHPEYGNEMEDRAKEKSCRGE